MSKKFVIFSLAVFFFTGCANLKTKDIAPYVPSLIERDLDIRVGMEPLKDVRPALDKELTRNITDVSKEVSEKLLEYFKQGTLRNINYPSQDDDDLVIIGEIRRFVWHGYSKIATYIPLVNLYVYMGLPCKTAYSFTHIYLELRDNKTGKLIDTFEEFSKVAKNYNLYEIKKIDSAAELEDSFKDVASKLRGRIAYKILTYARQHRSRSAAQINQGDTFDKASQAVEGNQGNMMTNIKENSQDNAATSLSSPNSEINPANVITNQTNQDNSTSGSVTQGNPGNPSTVNSQ